MSEQDRMELQMAFGELTNHDGARGKGFAVRRWLNLAILACAVLPVAAGLGAAPARAEFPEKIIKIVVPFSAGGGTDIIARTTAQELIMIGSAPQELDRYVAQEEERWRKLVKDANIEVQ
ncbi:hypothetical protein [Bradyrhizobium sp. USDA 4486]